MPPPASAGRLALALALALRLAAPPPAPRAALWLARAASSVAASASKTRNITAGRLPGGRGAVALFLERDVVEKFVRGSGSGGQSVAKTSNCVQLLHAPTGIVVRCHKTRSRDLNRVEARRLLQQRLDDLLHGAASRRAVKEAKRRKGKVRSHQRARAKAAARGGAVAAPVAAWARPPAALAPRPLQGQGRLEAADESACLRLPRRRTALAMFSLLGRFFGSSCSGTSRPRMRRKRACN